MVVDVILNVIVGATLIASTITCTIMSTAS
jgi:hypothetical protein